MNLTLGELITIKTTFEKRLDEELLKMECFFQDHLWDGYSNESDPEFIVAEDFEAMQALTDKIKHMVLNIGCPNSVRPMIASICQRKIKRWQSRDLFLGGMGNKGWVMGKQLKNKNEIDIVNKAGRYENNNNSYVITGHFRWNYKGYVLSRRATSLLSAYYSGSFFD